MSYEETKPRNVDPTSWACFPYSGRVISSEKRVLFADEEEGTWGEFPAKKAATFMDLGNRYQAQPEVLLTAPGNAII